MKTVWLWVPNKPEKWGRPTVIAVGGTPPHPGKVYAVECRSAERARSLVALATSEAPDKKADRSGYLDWEEATEVVSLVKGVVSRSELKAEKAKKAKEAKRD